MLSINNVLFILVQYFDVSVLEGWKFYEDNYDEEMDDD